jgi:hypothetical protein
MKRTGIVTVMTAWLIGTMSSASFAASDFEGVWKVKDTAGKQFEITLSGGGAAKATRGEGMTGSWKEEGNAAVITWNTGWTTKITKNGNRYEKTAYRKSEPLTGKPGCRKGQVRSASRGPDWVYRMHGHALGS